VAGYAYGSLTVRVTGDTKPLRDDIKTGATAAGQDAAKGVNTSMSSGLSALGGLGMAVGKSVATGLGVASGAAIGFGVAAFKSAARVSEMNASLKALAAANNLSYPAMQQTVTAIRKQGIEAGVAQGLVAEFAKNQLNLADATKLATVAQDAAVISGRNSTEVLDDLLHGIVTQNSLVLRNAGLNVQAGKAMDDYAKSVGKSTKDLTEAERAQAVLNATLESGKTVAGAYKLAMEEPGKVLRSFPRLVDDIKIAVGTGLVKAFGPAILAAYDMTKAFAAAVEPGGKLAPIFDAIGVAVGKLAAPIAGMVAGWAKWLDALKPEQIARVVDLIKQFGPAMAIAGGALAAFTGAGIITKLPIIGSLFSSILGPVKALGPVFMALPLPLKIAAAALLVLSAASEKFRSALIEFGGAVISALRPAFDAIVNGVKQALPPIRDLVRAIGDGLAPILRNLMPILGPLGQILGTVLAGAFKQLAQAATALAPIMSVVLAVLNFLVKAVVTVLAPLLRLAAGLVAAAHAAGTVVSPLQIIVSVCAAVANAIATVVRWIFGGSPGLIPAFLALGPVVAAAGAALMAIVGVFRAVASAIAAAWSAVTSTTAAAWSAVTSIVTSGAAAVRSAVTAGFNAARSAISSAMSAASSAVSSAFSAISGAARSGASAVLSAVSSSFGAVRGVVSSAMSAIPGIVSSALNSAVGAARAGGAAIMSGLQAGINSAAGAVMSTISSVAGKISGALSSALKIGSPSRLTIPMGAALAQGIGVGWEREIDHTLAGMGADLAAPHGGPSPLFGAVPGLGGLGAGGATINVYPQRGQDEREIAAMVSRELAWAQAGGL
jgi:phage-related protein